MPASLRRDADWAQWADGSQQLLCGPPGPVSIMLKVNNNHNRQAAHHCLPVWLRGLQLKLTAEGEIGSITWSNGT